MCCTRKGKGQRCGTRTRSSQFPCGVGPRKCALNKGWVTHVAMGTGMGVVVGDDVCDDVAVVDVVALLVTDVVLDVVKVVVREVLAVLVWLVVGVEDGLVVSVDVAVVVVVAVVVPVVVVVGLVVTVDVWLVVTLVDVVAEVVPVVVGDVVGVDMWHSSNVPSRYDPTALFSAFRFVAQSPERTRAYIYIHDCDASNYFFWTRAIRCTRYGVLCTVPYGSQKTRHMYCAPSAVTLAKPPSLHVVSPANVLRV